MHLYKVSYWQEGPARSDYHTVIVLANNKTIAKHWVNTQFGVYKCHYDETTVKLLKTKPKSVYLVEE